MLEFYFIDTAILSLITVYLLYKLFTRNFDYWKRKGIPYITPQLFFGNYYDILMFKKTIGHTLADMYNKISGPYFGIWVFNSPHFVAKDPELIKHILVKDFKYFQDRTIASNEEADEIAANILFIMKNPNWRSLRSKMTPIFSSGRIKCMIPFMNKVAEDLVSYLTKLSHQTDSIEAKEVCAKYATDVITSCAFGIEGHSFEKEDAAWRSVGRDMFEFTLSNGFRGTSYFFMPKLVDLFKIRFIPYNVSQFMIDAFLKTMSHRKIENSSRNDLIDILIKLQTEGDFDGYKFEGNRVIAQAAQFFLAGFETTSSTISYALYELCLNKPIQEKVVTEIKSALQQHGSVSYEAIQDMKYLHKVVQEILRKYPVLPFLDRKTTMDWKIPGTNITLEAGTPVYIPMFGLHYDPKYFPNPDVFDPERFTEETTNSRPCFSYIPFGGGPRNCIGERFGLIGTKVALVHILSRFEVECSNETPIPIEFEPKTFTLASKVGLPMRFVDVKRRASYAA
uniref:Antennae-rich cytochrome P450 n=1 Tax=Phyllopertha diversa TaxID=93416 RepID=Q695H1_PHYDV|nr:antennae-rich cytochrome P450 [Phyllopertha diversa]